MARDALKESAAAAAWINVITGAAVIRQGEDIWHLRFGNPEPQQQPKLEDRIGSDFGLDCGMIEYREVYGQYPFGDLYRYLSLSRDVQYAFGLVLYLMDQNVPGGAKRMPTGRLEALLSQPEVFERLKQLLPERKLNCDDLDTMGLPPNIRRFFRESSNGGRRAVA